MLDVPQTPTNGQLFTDATAGITWKWDGTKWVTQPFQLPAIPPPATVTVAFTTPGVGSTVAVTVSDVSWVIVGLTIFIDTYYTVNSIAGNVLTLQRLV